MKVYFHEDQHFRQSWLWIALLAVAIVAPIASVASGKPGTAVEATAVTLVVVALVAALFALARLETEVRSDEVIIAFHGLWPTRRIPLADIVDVEARRYSILDSGGWGVHFTMSGIAYNVSGNEGVFVSLAHGRRVLIGSQRASELAAAIQAARRDARP